MIQISKPEIIYIDNKARLKAEIEIDAKKNTIWFEVDKKYGNYLCSERSDAFVIGILSYAMRNGHDITCAAPMGEELYYKITTQLIEAIYKGSGNLHKTVITADIDSTELPTSNAVGTGISCGIDSFHVLSQQTNSQLKKHNVTHLTFNNVGSHGQGEHAIKLYNERKLLALKFAKEFEFELVESNSNIYDIIPQDHSLTHSYTSSFCIYSLQKLYSIYYYASGHTFLEFSLIDNDKKDSSYYDLLTTCMFSTKSLTIISEGATSSRLEKTEKVTMYEPSYNYLNVCTITASNCSKCEKCTRTLVALDALGKLDLYKNVFDIEYYKKHCQRYYSSMVKEVLWKNSSYVQVYAILKSKVSTTAKLKGFAQAYSPYISRFIPKFLKISIRKSLSFVNISRN